MKWFDNTALTIVIIGAINWLFSWDIPIRSSSLHLWQSLLAIPHYLYNRWLMRSLSD